MNPQTQVGSKKSASNSTAVGHPRIRVLFAVLGCLLWMMLSGCQSPQSALISEQSAPPSETITLREGDVVRVAFPGAPNLDSTQQVRRDGKIVLSLAGEVVAAGLSPVELEKEIIKLCGAQLVSKEVTVSVVSSSFPVFVTGAVLRPGKILSDRPLTAIEAVMEAGGFDYAKANLQAVVVIRQDAGRVKHFTLNLKSLLDGQQTESFYLRPSDIVYVPEKFTWF